MALADRLDRTVRPLLTTDNPHPLTTQPPAAQPETPLEHADSEVSTRRMPSDSALQTINRTTGH